MRGLGSGLGNKNNNKQTNKQPQIKKFLLLIFVAYARFWVAAAALIHPTISWKVASSGLLGLILVWMETLFYIYGGAKWVTITKSNK